MGVGVTCPHCRINFAFFCSNCKSYDTEIYSSLELANYFQTRTIYYIKCRSCEAEYDNVPCPACNTRIIPEKPFVQGDIGGANAKKCFIATACTGENSQIVKQLCSFRDDLLGKSHFGREFIKYYYIHSPSFAALMKRHRLLQALVKYFIIYPAYYAALAAMRFISLYKSK